MEYQIWSSESRRPGRFHEGYEPGDPMRMSADGEIEGPVRESALEELFQKFNRDDRPNTRTAHSLSVGDVVVLSDPSEQVGGAWAVRTFGFERLPHSALEELAAQARG